MEEELFRQEIYKMLKQKVVKKKLKAPERISKASRKFVIALSVVSIIGFLSITTESLFGFSIVDYVESAWLLTLGLGLILETSIAELKRIKRRGITSEMLGKVTMIVVGSMAIVASLLSLPQLYVQHSTFLAIKGIISILAIIFIIVQTWISKKE